MLSDIKIYLQQMEEIKNRVSFARSFLNSEMSPEDELFGYEIVCVHLRKILELIAFSTLAANKEEYSRVHDDFSKKWNAKKLLRTIEKINPDFYPKPVKFLHTDSKEVKVLDYIKDGFLHRDDWLKLYDLCSTVLHVWNPYDEKERHINFEKSVTEWVQRIQNLLGLHYVQLLEGQKRATRQQIMGIFERSIKGVFTGGQGGFFTLSKWG